MLSPTRVLVCDDSPGLRITLVRALAYLEDMKVVAEASDGNEAVRATQQAEPDVILMDHAMPGMSGADAVRRIRELGIETPVLMLTADDQVQDRERDLRNTIFLIKGAADVRQVVKAIRDVVGR